MTVKSEQSGVLPEKILYGPFTLERRELVIAEDGLYSRSERATKFASLLFSLLIGAGGIFVIVDGFATTSSWAMVLAGILLIALAVLGIREFRRVEYRPAFRIVDGRIIVNGQDCGSSDGAYVQYSTKWTYEVLIVNDQHPGGLSVIAFASGRHLSQLCGLLMAHLHLDASRTMDWPPPPDKGS